MSSMSSGSEPETPPLEPVPPISDSPQWPPGNWQAVEARNAKRSLAIAAGLFLLTSITTLAVGIGFATSYAEGRSPRLDDIFATYSNLLTHPGLLIQGIPYAFTLMGILLAHELGHYFACRYY